jgi:hypothetical protein
MSDKDQAKWLAEFYQQVADGGQMQLQCKDGEWCKAHTGPYIFSTKSMWRVVQSERNKDD